MARLLQAQLGERGILVAGETLLDIRLGLAMAREIQRYA